MVRTNYSLPLARGGKQFFSTFTRAPTSGKGSAAPVKSEYKLQRRNRVRARGSKLAVGQTKLGSKSRSHRRDGVRRKTVKNKEADAILRALRKVRRLATLFSLKQSSRPYQRSLTHKKSFGGRVRARKSQRAHFRQILAIRKAVLRKKMSSRSRRRIHMRANQKTGLQ